MKINLEGLLEECSEKIGELTAKEVLELVKFAKNDNEEFIRRQGKKLEMYMVQLLQKKITKPEFEGYVEDIKVLTQMQKRKMNVAARASAQRLIKGITDIVMAAAMAAI